MAYKTGDVSEALGFDSWAPVAYNAGEVVAQLL